MTKIPALPSNAGKGRRRVPEIATLTWNQVDLEQGIVRIEAGQTKNAEARTIYLDDELMEILITQR